MAANDWYEDPSGRHELRWWANGAWTPSVSDGGAIATDPISDSYPPPGATPSLTATGPLQASQPAPPGVESLTPPGGTSPGGAPPPGFGAPPPQAFATPPPQQAGGWTAAPVHGGSAQVPGTERLRTGAPGPVAWAAVLLSAPGLILTLYGLVALFLAGEIDNFNDDFGGSDFGDDASDSVAGVGVFMLALGGFYLATAVGLIMLAPWSRIAGIIIASLHALLSLAVLSQAAEGGVVMLLLAGAQIWLLLTPTAQQGFKTRAIHLSEAQEPLRA